MAGYTGFAIIFMLLTTVLSGVIQIYYTKKSYRLIPWGTHAFLLLSLFVAIVPFPLLVIDVDSGLNFEPTEEAPLKPEHNFLRAWWGIIFFSTQVLAWIVLPVAQEYDNSGAFTPGARLKQSLKSNVKMYIILGIVVGILFGYIVFLKDKHSLSGIVSLALAAANAFGLCLLVIFLSCGLVGLPRSLWRKADPVLQLRYFYYGAVDLQEEFDIVKMDLAELKAEVVAMDPRATDDGDKRKLMTLLDIIDETVQIVPVHHSAASRAAATIDSSREVDSAYLVDVSTRTRSTTRLAMRLHYQLETLKQDCIRLDAIVGGNADGLSLGKKEILYWNVLRKPFLRVLAVCAGIMTILVMWSELVLPLQAATQKTLSVAELAARNPTTSFVGSAVFLFYMAATCYWATFQFKVFNIFQLVPSHTDAASLCFICTFLTRLILPLCYNFLWISDLTKKGFHVTYSSIFGKMDVVDFLGPWFNQFLPVAIPILCVLIETRFFDKLMEQAGVDRHDPTDLSKAVVRQRIQDGRQLMSQIIGRELTASTGSADRIPSASNPNTPKATAVQMTTQPEAKPERGRRYAEWKAKRAAEGNAGAA